MEFLLTYGWAIIVFLIVIAALSYFGILNPAKILPDKCLFQVGINCKDYTASSEQILFTQDDLDALSGGSVTLTQAAEPKAYPFIFDLENNLGETLYITKIEVEGDGLQCMQIQLEECESRDTTSFLYRLINDGVIDFSRKCFSLKELCSASLTKGICVDKDGNDIDPKSMLRWADGQSFATNLQVLSSDYLYIPCTGMPDKGQKTDAVIKIEYSKSVPILNEKVLDESVLTHTVYGSLKTTVS